MEQQEAFEKISLVESRLSYHLNGFQGKYGCQIIFEDRFEKNEVRYKLNIKYLGTIDDFTSGFSIERGHTIYINDTPPDSFMDELAYESSRCIYPLQIKVNHDGTLLEITNHQELVDRWSKEKKRIKKYYKGTLVDKYLKLHEKTIFNSERLLDKIKKDWFITLYFSEIYINYSDEYYVLNKKKYPIAGKAAPVQYETKQSIEGQEDESSNEYLVKIKGTINDERCALDIEQQLDHPLFISIDNSSKDLKGNCDITYMITKEDGILEGFEATFDTKFQESKKITVKMYLLEKVIQNNDDIDASEESFWGKFFKKLKN